MRSALGIVGFTASAVIVAIAGRFGFATSGEPLDGIMWAFFYGLLALGAIGGPAVAVRVGRVAPVWGVIAGFFVCAVIAGNISVTFGASVGRSDRMLAERMRASQAGQFDAAELQRVQRERAEMKYTPATAADVKAAQEAVAAAERSRIAECDKRGPTAGRVKQRSNPRAGRSPQPWPTRLLRIRPLGSTVRSARSGRASMAARPSSVSTRRLKPGLAYSMWTP